MSMNDKDAFSNADHPAQQRLCTQDGRAIDVATGEITEQE